MHEFTTVTLNKLDLKHPDYTHGSRTAYNRCTL